MNRKAISGAMYGIIVCGILLIILLGLFFILSLVGPPISSLLDDSLNRVIVASGNETSNNVSDTFTTVLSPVSTTVQMSKFLAYAFISLSLIGFFVTAYYVRSYPFVLPIWIGFMIILGVLSIFFTVSYVDMTAGDQAQAYASWAETDFIMRYLPHIMIFMAVVGGIIMFALASKSSNELGGSGGYPV